MMFSIRLPVPPSNNQLFVSFHNGRHIETAKTKAYRAWITAAGWQLNIQRPKPIKGPVSLHIKCPENARRDLSNHLKALEDLLVGMSLIQSDRNACVRRIEMAWHSDHADMEVTVRAI